ncbi:hypothetical protein [Methylobacter sp. sgz302048]|uniref:hypothetical protein n=1 Tax=Methylobacter sp. sgz302048 TaxID=3455945 RepID=UPI003FA0A932
MKTITLAAMLTLSLFATEAAIAANHYVRAGATGANNGNDWNNAYTSLPSTLTRGDTYYIAGGKYPAYTFDDPESGSSVITIKKAIASDHGTDTGWQATYGSTQAVFDSQIVFNRSNYVFDGQTRNENDWFDGASYGIQVYHSNQLNQNIIIGPNGGPAANNITVKNVYIDAPYKNLPSNQTIRQYAVDTDTYGGPQHTGLVFSRMYVRGSNNVWFLRSTTGAIVEYSASDGVVSNGANHGEIVNLYYSGINAVIRYNKFRNAYLDSGGTAIVAITDGPNPIPGAGSGLEFYGNIVYNFQTGDASIGFDGYAKGFKTSNSKVYNNTFIGSIGGNAGTAFGGGANNLVYNNLFINNRGVGFDGGPGTVNDYNGFSDSNARGQSHAQTNVPTSIFANFNSNDFSLKSPTNAGYSLSSPYNKDLLSNTRGTDGKFDIGAYEFGGSTQSATTGTSTLLPPTNLRVQ